MEHSLTQNVATLFENMENFAQKEGLIGKPVTQGDKTFLPVLSMTVGYGGGDMRGKNQQASATSTTASGTDALGIGAKLCTDALIIIDNNNVSVTPISSPGNMSQMIDKIPQILTSFAPNSQQKQQQGAQ